MERSKRRTRGVQYGTGLSLRLAQYWGLPTSARTGPSLVIERVSWEESKVLVNLSRDIIKRSPAYTPESLTRDYETELHQHYRRQGYWADGPAVEQH